MKFYVLARFRETIPMVKFVSSSEIYRINSRFLTKLQFCNQNYDFAIFLEIGISRVLHIYCTFHLILSYTILSYDIHILFFSYTVLFIFFSYTLSVIYISCH